MNALISKLIVALVVAASIQCTQTMTLQKHDSATKIINGDTLSYYSADSTDSWYFTLAYFKKALSMNLRESLFTGVKVYWLQPAYREYMFKLVKQDSIPLLEIYYPVGVTITEALADSLVALDSLKNIGTFSALAGCHSSLKKLPVSDYNARIIIQKVTLVDSTIAKTFQEFFTSFAIDSMKSVVRKNSVSTDSTAVIVEVYNDSLINRFKFFAGDTIDSRYSWIVRNVRGMLR